MAETKGENPEPEFKVKELPNGDFDLREIVDDTLKEIAEDVDDDITRFLKEKFDNRGMNAIIGAMTNKPEMWDSMTEDEKMAAILWAGFGGLRKEAAAEEKKSK